MKLKILHPCLLWKYFYSLLKSSHYDFQWKNPYRWIWASSLPVYPILSSFISMSLVCCTQSPKYLLKVRFLLYRSQYISKSNRQMSKVHISLKSTDYHCNPKWNFSFASLTLRCVQLLSSNINHSLALENVNHFFWTIFSCCHNSASLL